MAGFSILSQEELTRLGVEPFFEQLPKLAQDVRVEDQEYVSAIADEMFPVLCDPVLIERAGVLIAKNGDFPTFVLKNLKIRKQEEERCVRARAFAKISEDAMPKPDTPTLPKPEPKPSPSASESPDSGPSPLPSPDVRPSPSGL